ncbi:cytochrome c3 family protein [Microvirga brassicacearum]|uniref:cytochrome c3 family protein n=1 Tax=Microvirga brassicacearum TaxID=2580413 RepID=UPI001FCF163C|nr:cytochrome c3 family protein [Microvirga brassicacearum]
MLAYIWTRAGSSWNIGKPANQPVPFRHDLHSGLLKIDCRYCHSTVERAADAGMPSAQTCMSCHSEVWIGATVLEPVRSSFALSQPIIWTSVHRLPDYVYFHHAAHVTKGVACETCHGRVDRMPRTVKTETLSMGWCLDCHRDPVPQLRPRGAVLAMGSGPHAMDLPDDLRVFYREAFQRLTSCNTCHR